MPMRGSLRSRINSATSRWIWSATRKPRLGIDGLCRMGFPSAQTRTPPFFGGRGSGESRYRLQRPGDFLDLEELEQVAFLDVVVVFQLDAALEAGGDLADVVLHAPHGLDLAGVDDDVLAQQAEARAAADDARRDHRPRDGADLRRHEHGADLGRADRLLALLGREHAGHRRLDLVDRVVDDVVVADVDAVVLGELSRSGVGADVEADDHGLRCDREVDVAFADAADRGVDDLHLDLVGRELEQRLRQRFLRTLYVGLDDQRQLSLI